jgi:eukaryotic-like serine/threonine-protein kinase
VDAKSAEVAAAQAPEAVGNPAVEPPPPAEARTEVAMKAEPVEPVEEPKTEAVVEPPKLPEKLSPSDWITQYDGGPCFHVVGDNPRGGKMSIEGFGDRVEPFEKLDKSFQTAFGVEPQIRLRAITKKQCPVVEFVHVSKSQMAFALKTDFLKAGEPVDASLSNVTAENIGVFVVTPDGIIVNVTSMSNRYEDEVTIQIPNEALVSRAGGEYLLLAVASDKPLASLDSKGAPDAAAFLESLRQEGKGGTVTSAVKYLRKK